MFRGLSRTGPIRSATGTLSPTCACAAAIRRVRQRKLQRVRRGLKPVALRLPERYLLEVVLKSGDGVALFAADLEDALQVLVEVGPPVHEHDVARVQGGAFLEVESSVVG